GLEIASPRGRIAAMRAVESGAQPVDDAFTTAMHECVQCRGCEAACPSGVPFGALMSDTRAALAEHPAHSRGRIRTLALRTAMRALDHPKALRALGWPLLAAQRTHLDRFVPQRFHSSLPALSSARLRDRDEVGSDPTCDVWVFTGCVMDAWMADVHRATADVLRATGARVSRPRPGAACCGALHEHAGLASDAARHAERVMASMPGDAPIAVDSAGCGAAMKGYGELLGTDEARAFSARVRDVAELVVARGLPPVRPMQQTVVIQDPCHLRHVQHSHLAVRTLLGAAYDLVETDDDGLCCGAGGAYAALEPELATQIRARKLDALDRAGAAPGGRVVASANPGCMMHLQAAGLTVAHPIALFAAALDIKEAEDRPSDREPTISGSETGARAGPPAP
ncbi:MAG TPA: (Fe-S)-binding protein, partial [Acidimicrobiia bacterium]